MGILPLKGFSTLPGIPSVKLIIAIVFFTSSNIQCFFFFSFSKCLYSFLHLPFIYCLSCVFECFFTIKICLQVNDVLFHTFYVFIRHVKLQRKIDTWHQSFFPASRGEIYTRHGWILRDRNIGDIVKFF